ncbi:hypothetical protein KFK09_003424 [Dendrobium nobile]|uniref:Uncharacterized protein n=1 Tax=Dendrobium nobile TaxID=94219 RepID=A0A8T3C186_DENNO|nr:hypothetical protein KFK09_003424 [Dendrobium nobile]
MSSKTAFASAKGNSPAKEPLPAMQNRPDRIIYNYQINTSSFFKFCRYASSSSCTNNGLSQNFNN